MLISKIIYTPTRTCITHRIVRCGGFSPHSMQLCQLHDYPLTRVGNLLRLGLLTHTSPSASCLMSLNRQQLDCEVVAITCTRYEDPPCGQVGGLHDQQPRFCPLLRSHQGVRSLRAFIRARNRICIPRQKSPHCSPRSLSGMNHLRKWCL
jgi:hypothetical protein